MYLGLYLTTSVALGDYVHLSPYLTGNGGAKSKLIGGSILQPLQPGSRLICVRPIYGLMASRA
jgi:hypothetical protein